MRRIVWIVMMAAVLAAATTPRPARSGQITYTTTGVGSGFLDTTPFTDLAFTITILADPSQVQDLGFAFGVNNTSTTVRLGSTNLTAVAGSSYVNKTPIPSGAQFFYSGVLVGEFFDSPNLDLFNPNFVGYDLKTPLGPLSIADATIFSISTDQGFLTFSSLSQVRFTATVPEPSTWALAAAGGLFSVGFRLGNWTKPRRRRNLVTN